MYNDTQPYTQYAPPPPPPPSRKKRGPLFWAVLIIGSIVLLIIGGNAINAMNTSATQDTSTPVTQATTQPTATDTPIPTATDTPTPAPTPKPLKWTTTHTFSGNGSKKTGTFSTPDDWKIEWKCNPASFSIAYNVIITVYNSDGTYADSGVNATCSRTNTHDETEEHQGGSVYLDIISEGDWTVTIQEMK